MTCLLRALAVVALATVGLEAHAGSPRAAIVDVTPAFWSVVDAPAPDERARAERFLDTLVGPHPQLFGRSVLYGAALTGRPRAEAVSRVERYLQSVQPYLGRMREVSVGVREAVERSIDAFPTRFPDYSPTMPIYVTVSLFTFDGGTREMDGRTVLLFGIDGMARFHAPDENPKVLVDHELFHAYHAQVLPGFAADGTPLWQQIWEEGLATYVSERLNPSASEADVLLSPTLAAEAGPRLNSLARALLDGFDSTAAADTARFFMMQADASSGIPPRAGYYVGLQVARRVAEGRSLHQLAQLRGPELETLVRAALQSLADS